MTGMFRGRVGVRERKYSLYSIKTITHMEFPRYDRNTSVCVSVYFIYLFIYLT